MASEIDLNALGQATDTTFTRSGASYGPTPSYSVKAKILSVDEDIKVSVTFFALSNMTTDREFHANLRKIESEADEYIKSAAKKISSDYKESTGSSLSMKQDSVSSQLEAVDYNSHNGKRRMLLRRTATFSV